MNEIVLQGDGALIMSSGGDLSELIKPLTREIHLFDIYIYIAGTANTARQLIDRLNNGDNLDLRSESNKYEENVVAVYSEGNKVGYNPEKDVIIFLRLLDAGKALTAKVSEIDRSYNNLAKIKISIYLIDF